MALIRGKLIISRLLAVSARTREISDVFKTVAADIGMDFRKNDRSRTRIARLIGGRNIGGRSLWSGLERAAGAMIVGSMRDDCRVDG